MVVPAPRCVGTAVFLSRQVVVRASVGDDCCLLLSLWCGGCVFLVKKLVMSGIVAIFAVTFGRMRSGRRRNVRVRCGFGAARARAYQGVGEPISLSVR